MEDSESDLKPHVVHIKSEMDPLDCKTSADVALLDGKAMHIPSIGTADSKPDAQTVYEESDVKPSTSKNDGVSALEVMKLLNPSIDDVSQPKEPTDSAKGRSCALCLASPSVEDLREVNSQEQLLVFLSGLLLGSEIADDVAFRIYKENHAVNSYYCRRHFSTAFLHIAHEVRETAGQTSVHDLALASGAKTGLLQRIRKITTLLDAEVEISGSDLSQFYWNCQNDYADQGYEVEEEVSRISMATRRKSYTTIFKLNAVQYALEHGTSAAAVHCKVSERVIRRWKAGKENLEDVPLRKRANRFGKRKMEEIDEAVYSWIVQRQEASRAVLVKDIRAKALQLAQESGRQDFKASASWCKLFMKRKNLVVRRGTVVSHVFDDDEHGMKTE